MPLDDVLKTIRRYQLVEEREAQRMAAMWGGEVKPRGSTMSEADKIALVKRLAKKQ